MELNDDTYKLYYFNANGRGLIIRAILEYSKAKWEDIKVSNEEWVKMKTHRNVSMVSFQFLNVTERHIVKVTLLNYFSVKHLIYMALPFTMNIR